MEQQIMRFDTQTARSEILKQLEQIQNSKFIQLPENYKESAFFAIEALSNMEGIEKVAKSEITKALIAMFNNKLDFRKNHCYFFVQNDEKKGKSLRFGWQYQGLIYIAKTQCNVQEVIPVLIYEHDEFESHYDFGALIIDKHIPKFEGNIIGGYCVVEFINNNRLIKYFTKLELDQRRNRSMSKAGKFWQWEREMYEKTLINATLKRIIETSGTVEASNLYEEQNDITEREIIKQSEPDTLQTIQI